MNVALWIMQGLLAVIFAASGVSKSTQSKKKLIAMGQTGVAPFPLPVVRFAAYCELLGVVGVIVPWLTGIAPILTPLAAAGFAVIMVAAIASHAYLKEPLAVVYTSVILVMAVVVSAGRIGVL
ncbi:MAG: DoxX family protein [Micromonosporaceae bacterium]